MTAFDFKTSEKKIKALKALKGTTGVSDHEQGSGGQGDRKRVHTHRQSCTEYF